MEQLDNLNRRIREQEEELDNFIQEKYRLQREFEEKRDELARTNSRIQLTLDEIYQTTLQDIASMTQEDGTEERATAQRIIAGYYAAQEEAYRERQRELVYLEEEALEENRYKYGRTQRNIEALYDERRYLMNER